MKVKRYIYATLGALVLAAACFSTYRYVARPIQPPEFPEVAPGAIAAVVEMEPDFGYRTGDIISVRIWIRQPAGITCSTKNLVVNGSTKLRDMKVTRQKMEDGSQLLRLDAQFQSFIFEQRAKAELKLEYKENGSREVKDLQLPALEYSTSQTFDGDKSTKHPKDPPFVYATSYGWLANLGVATLALALATSSFWYLLKRPVLRLRRKKEALVPGTDAWQAAIDQVHAILARLKAGEEQVPLLVGIDGLLRRLYNLDAVTVKDLYVLAEQRSELMSLTLSSEFCQQAIYAGKLLEASEIEKLSELVVEALGALPRFRENSQQQAQESCS